MEALRENKLLSTSHQQAGFSHVLESRALICIAVVWGDRHLHNESPPSFAFATTYCGVWHYYGMKHPFGQFRQAAMAMSPPSLLPIPYSLGGGWTESWCCASNAQQQTKHCCDTWAVWATCAEHSTAWATAEKADSIPAQAILWFSNRLPITITDKRYNLHKINL